MPTEVLVMCTGCGRPQAAGQALCVACGAPLPDAPMPAKSSPEAPFLLLDLGGGRMVAGVDQRLSYRADATVQPTTVELGTLQTVGLGRRLFLEALAIIPLALVLTLLLPVVRPVASALSGLALLVTLLWRHHFLVVKRHDGESVRWPLGTALIGSERARRIHTAWSSASQALAARGVTVKDIQRGRSPRA